MWGQTLLCIWMHSRVTCSCLIFWFNIHVPSVNLLAAAQSFWHSASVTETPPYWLTWLFSCLKRHWCYLFIYIPLVRGNQTVESAAYANNNYKYFNVAFCVGSDLYYIFFICKITCSTTNTQVDEYHSSQNASRNKIQNHFKRCGFQSEH